MSAHASSTNYYYQIWRSKAFVVVLIVIVVMLIISVSQEFARRLETRYEIQQLEAEVAKLSGRNTEMQTLIKMLNTSTVQDREARIKLGMQDSGERLIILPDQAAQSEIILPDAESIEAVSSTDSTPNPQKWLAYFKDKFYKAQ